MKKIGLLLLTILLSVFIAPFFNRTVAFASETPSAQNSSDKIETGIFLPTSYLQYYKLVNPFAVCRYKTDSEEFVAISHKDAIVIYKNEKFAKIDLDLKGKSVTGLQRYQNYLLYLYNSVVWALDINGFEDENWSPNPVMILDPSSQINYLISGASFSVCGDNIVCYTSDYIYKYTLTKDLSGNISVAPNPEFIEQNKTSMLLLSVSGKVYFSKSDSSGIFVWDNGSVAPFIIDAQNVRMLTEDESGEFIYFSCPDGVYSIDVKNGQKSTVASVSEFNEDSDLGKIYSPQGICLVDDKLWVVDGSINAVQEIDLTSGNKFTQFAITTNSKAVNRLSSNVEDIAVDKDTIYALDEGRIVVVNDINSTERTYSRINLGAPIDKFSAGNGYICYSVAKSVFICEIIPVGEDGIEFELGEIKSTSLDGNIKDISYSEGNFYVISDAYYGNDNDSHPLISKVDVRDKSQEFKLETVIHGETEVGKAVQVTADVFGTIYYCAEDEINGDYEFYSYDGNSVEFIASRPKTSAIRNLQTDFDGKLYCLYDQNSVEIIDGGEITAKTLATSSNLGAISPAKSMCLSCNSDKAYFIFEGLILNSSNPFDLNIATPHTIDIPQDFSTAYNANGYFARVKQGAKLFKIDITELSGEHFKFIDYSETETAQTDYAVIPLGDKYSILIKDGVSAIARNSDITETFTARQCDFSKFAVVEFSPYSIPVLESPYVSNHSVDKFKTVKIVGEITFNGTAYYIVKDGENLGYIPQTFTVDTIVTEDGNVSLGDVYVYKKGGVAVLDEDGNQIGVLDKKTKVTVLKRGNLLKIAYGDGIGYVDSDAIVLNSQSEIMKTVAIFLACLSACVTAVYFEKRFLLRR